MLHIGIAACSAEGAALCYRTICLEASALLGGHRHPEVTMHTPPLAAYVERIEADDWDGVADLMVASAHKLHAAGADFVVCPDNTIHQAFDRAQPRSPLPWLHIADAVAAEAEARGFRRLGLTGTRWTMASDTHPRALAARGLSCLRPTEDDQRECSRIIMEELVLGVLRPASVRFLEELTGRLRDAGCDAIVLGCTELPLVLHDGNAALPTLDSTRLLARAALRRALDRLS